MLYITLENVVMFAMKCTTKENDLKSFSYPGNMNYILLRCALMLQPKSTVSLTLSSTLALSSHLSMITQTTN